MKRGVEQRIFPVECLISPAEDLPGKWVAHCLTFDVVTYGDSIGHAIEMAMEASGMVVLDDLNQGLDPLARWAPEEMWRRYRAATERGEPVVIADIPATFRGEVVCCFDLMVVRPAPAARYDDAAPTEPAVCQAAA